MASWKALALSAAALPAPARSSMDLCNANSNS
eukprot:CAMPEP_0115604776 /NCGR_PEP_ID=MMETSP0272-20121206/17120_1 /TAXON_ID=71861 /ORGANISM="Scrippsiella trochoidea, Strain CCMP3099" /LENGTH=31 /DNA_ID= /DNA_START= /DNA_END= /DNA_ORIENTATION=